MKDDKKVVKSETTDRRALLKGLVAGSAVVTGSKALPESWVKPMADAVVLPGHAQTTVGDYIGGDGGYGETDFEYTDEGTDDYSGDYAQYSYGDEYGDGDYGSDNGSDAQDDGDYIIESEK